MDTVIIIALILMAIFGLCAFVYVITYNKIQKTLIRIKEAEKDIDESLRKKYDTLINMEKLINDNTDLNQNNFEELKKENIKISNFEMDRKLSKANEIFKAIKSDYEEELNIDSYKELEISLMTIDERCDAAKTFYNKYTTKLNTIINTFPSNIVARMHNVNEHLYFDNKNMNDDDIKDFKL